MIPQYSLVCLMRYYMISFDDGMVKEIITG